MLPDTSALYLDDGQHLGKGVLGGGHGGQEAEEMVSRRIGEHLEIVGGVLWAKHGSGTTLLCVSFTQGQRPSLSQ